MKIDLNKTFITSKNEQMSWKDLIGKYNGVVLFFYPKAFTSGCTIEVNQYNNRLSEFNNLNYTVAGISRDNPKLNDDFSCEYNINFPLICDMEAEIHKLFDVISKDIVSENGENKTIRSTFIIDKNGDVIHEMRNVKPSEHINEVIKYLTK